MGRFGALFRKADDKEKLSTPSTQNPYAQQPSASPPPQYGDQSPQYDNQSYHQGPQPHGLPSGPRAGLPSGPRQGGGPSSGVAPVSSRTSTWETNKSTPPPYSLNSSNPPPYPNPPPTSASGTPVLPPSSAGPALRSAGASTSLHSTSSSPSLGSGYPREKLGASNGVGRNRFDNGAPQYGQAASVPSQRQGGYGNLDTERGGLFGNYNGPSKQTAQPGVPDGPQRSAIDSGEMTGEEKEDAEYQSLRQEANAVRNQTVGSTDRSVETLFRAIGVSEETYEATLAQGEHLEKTRRHLLGAKQQARVARQNTDLITALNKSMFRPVLGEAKRADFDAAAQAAEKAEHAEMENAQREGYRSKMEIEATRRALANTHVLGAPKNKGDRSKYFLEEDSEEEEAENRIDGNLARMEAGIAYLKKQQEAHHAELVKQNALIGEMVEESEIVRDKISREQKRIDWLNRK